MITNHSEIRKLLRGSDPTSVEDRIWDALQSAADGLTRTQLRKVVGTHVSKESLDKALLALVDKGWVGLWMLPNGRGSGRPTQLWTVNPSKAERE